MKYVLLALVCLGLFFINHFSVLSILFPQQRDLSHYDATNPKNVVSTTLSWPSQNPIAQVDKRFLSVAIDISQLVGGNWWAGSLESKAGKGVVKAAPFPFENPKLRQLARALAPGVLRIGGSEADDVHYAVQGSEQKKVYGEHTLTPQLWQSLYNFSQAIAHDLMFTLNAGPSSRESGELDLKNIQNLLNFVKAAQQDVYAWELGNELNAYWFLYGWGQQISPDQYLKDLSRVRALLQESQPQSLLAGPSSAFWPLIGEPLGFLFGMNDPVTRQAEGLLDIITWHYYPAQSVRCFPRVRAAKPSTFLVPEHLNEVQRWAGHVENLQQEHAPTAQVWLGETGSAQCGGQPGVSTSFVGSFWWLDQLGTIAKRGQPVMIRQTLVGSDYGLLDDKTFEPRPDYWTSWMWQQLMGSKVLAVEVRKAEKTMTSDLRVYAHCTARQPDSITLVLINLSPEDAQQVDLGSVQWDAKHEAHFAAANDLMGQGVTVNGQTLKLKTDGALPTIPWLQKSGAQVRLSPLSYAFIKLENTQISACSQVTQ